MASSGGSCSKVQRRGEVRDYPIEGKGSAWVEHTVGSEMAARRREDGAGGSSPVAQRGHEA
jgi:hypothetical protein